MLVREEWRARFEVVARIDEFVEKTVTRLTATTTTVSVSTDPFT